VTPLQGPARLDQSPIPLQAARNPTAVGILEPIQRSHLHSITARVTWWWFSASSDAFPTFSCCFPVEQLRWQTGPLIGCCCCCTESCELVVYAAVITSTALLSLAHKRSLALAQSLGPLLARGSDFLQAFSAHAMPVSAFVLE
jgi:hypothetical protein